MPLHRLYVYSETAMTADNAAGTLILLYTVAEMHDLMLKLSVGYCDCLRITLKFMLNVNRCLNTTLEVGS